VGCVLSNDMPPPATWSRPGLWLANAHLAHGQRSTATFDGRLDNRTGLLERLGGSPGAEASDAALAIAVYERWGVEGFAHLIGDWSLALWDESRHAVILASDYAGIRPLYYSVERGRAMWLTRLRPLVNCLEADELDDTWVAGFLVFSACPNRTPYRGVYSVPPGHAVEVTDGGARVQPFWKLPVDELIRYPDESEYEEQLRSLFREAVRCRVPTDGEYLCDLSGGFDSSTAVTMAADLFRAGEARSKPVTLSFEHEGSVDEPFYAAVARFCGCESIRLSTADHPFLTETAVGGAAPAFWQALLVQVAEVARKLGATTYMTGLPGDTVMANWWNDSSQVAGLLRDGRLGAALQQSLAWSKLLHVPIGRVLWKAVLASLPASCATARWFPKLGWHSAVQESEDSIAPAFRKHIGIGDWETLFSQDWIEARPERRNHYRALMNTLESRQLAPPEPIEHLNYVHPFAHRPLVTFMLSIPVDIACRPGEPRRLMRRAFGGLWPPELRQRRSKDQLDRVFLESLRPLARAFFQPGQPLQVVERGYIDRASLDRRIERLSMSLACNEGQLRQIILLEMWLRQREGRRRSPATIAGLV